MPTTADQRSKSMGEHRTRHLTTSERLMQLAKVGLFADVSIDAVVDLSRGQEEVHGKAGDVLWVCGDPSTFNSRIEYGRVKCTNAQGREVVVAPIFVLGVMDIFAEVPRPYTAVAETDYIAINTPAHVFDAVIENHMSMGRVFQAGFARVLLGDS